MKRLLTLLWPALIVTLIGVPAAASEAIQPDEQNLRLAERYDQRMVWIEGTRETDPSGIRLEGVRLSWGMISGGSDCMGPMGIAFYLDHKTGDYQRVTGSGLQLLMPYVPIGSQGVAAAGLRFKLGIEQRHSAPDKGIGGVAGVGIEVGVWIGHRAQVALMVDRDFGFPSGTRNQVARGLRFGVARVVH